MENQQTQNVEQPSQPISREFQRNGSSIPIRLKLVMYVQLWNSDLKVRLLNCKTLNAHPNRLDCANDLLSTLVNDYRSYAVDQVLLRTCEAQVVLKEFDPNYHYVQGPHLKTLFNYRNKLIAHRDENSGTDVFTGLLDRIRSAPWQLLVDTQIGGIAAPAARIILQI